MNAISRARTADDAYRLLHDEIVEGVLKPGSRLREGEIAERMGLSRTPIREALQRLEGAGLVSHIPHKGAVVRQLDYQAANELYRLREVLEGTAAGFAALHMSEPELQAVRDIVEAERAAPDAREAARLNKMFHRALAHGAHNRYLLETLDGLALAQALLGPSTLTGEARRRAAVEEHGDILDAIADRDGARAEEAARAHIRGAQRVRLAMLLADDA
ncbi:MAG: GntR family transcriptional regulator [Pseudomonadota bacterium]